MNEHVGSVDRIDLKAVAPGQEVSEDVPQGMRELSLVELLYVGGGTASVSFV